MPSDAHHLRFARHRALGRKVSDEFTVPLCRGHHREVHRSGDEAAWWKKIGIDPIIAARALWLETHPVFAPAHDVSADVAMPKIAARQELGNSTQFRGSQNGSRYEATLWRQADQALLALEASQGRNHTDRIRP